MSKEHQKEQNHQQKRRRKERKGKRKPTSSQRKQGLAYKYNIFIENNSQIDEKCL